MATIAILGYGTVGSGVLEVLRRNAASIERRAGQPVTVKYICDIRDFSSHPDAALFVNNIDVILSDPEVTAVVETIGGLKPAYFYVKSALESGRHVVTSNKELVATHGAELLAIARRRGVCFLFEASVGGGTPIITPMHQCMAANVISEIAGIVNGTTNFMLTKMARENMDFGAALKLAQSLGYAETIDPSADVDGIDAQRKISILASLAFGRHFFPQNVPTRGIRDVSVKDIALAARQGAAVRLIAWARRGDDGSVALAVLVMTPVVFAIAAFSPRLESVMKIITLLPYAIPGVISAAALLRAYGGTDLPMVLVLAGAYFVLGMPLVYSGINNAMHAIDIVPITEAARVLGASTWTTFLRIIVPGIAPGILVSTLLSFSTLFGEFVVANLLIGGSFETVQIYLYLIMKQTGHLSSAVVVIYVFIMTIICAAVMKLSSGKKENMQLKEEKP